MPADDLLVGSLMTPFPGPPKPPRRNALGAGLALLGLAVVSLVVLLLFNVLGSSVFAVKLEEGVFPPNSDSVVRRGRLSVLTATVLIFVAAGLAASAVAVRPHPLLQVLGAITFVVLVPLLLLAFLCFGLVI